MTGPGATTRSPRRARLLPALAACLLAACAATPPTHSTAGEVVFIVVRHAEKAEDGTRDPALSEAGHLRAVRLAQRFADRPLAAIYTTDLRRTRQTVAPVASAQRLEMRTYDPREPAASFVARLLSAHPQGTVLVAGHSNTVPAIVGALCACDADDMPETEFDRISTVQIGPDGKARLETARY